MLLAADHIKDMDIGERLAILGPVLYLLPLAVVIILGVVLYRAMRRLWERGRLKRTVAYMSESYHTEKEKTEQLAAHLSYRSAGDLKRGFSNCPVCMKKYSSRSCPDCGTYVGLGPEENYRAYYYIEKANAAAPSAEEHRESFERLSELVKVYRPYVDNTPDAPDDKISVTITFR